MPDLVNAVGKSQKNDVHDVALIQAMLKLTKNDKAKPFLTGGIDGEYGAITQGAIDAFQKANPEPAKNTAKTESGKATNEVKTAVKAAATSGGIIKPGSFTVRKLTEKLPADRKDLRVLKNQKLVYVGGAATSAKASESSVRNDKEMRATFKKTAADLIKKFYDDYHVILAPTTTGRRRNFAQQAALSTASTKAGPGESNHQYGNAIDLGFSKLSWLKSDGTVQTDDFWLNKLSKVNAKAGNAFWDTRDKMALAGPFNLHRLKMERIHLQDFDNASVSMKKSMAALLTSAGKWKWRSIRGGYECDLGGSTGKYVSVGSARKIWAGTASVSAAEVKLTGWVRPAGNKANVPGSAPQLSLSQSDSIKPVAGNPAQTSPLGTKAKTAATGSITAADLTDIKAALLAEFKAADAAWRSWKAVK